MNTSILSQYFSHIELHISSEPEFTSIFGKRVKEVVGSRYSECRGYSSVRYVTVCINTEEGLKLVSTIMSRFPADVIILRNPKKNSHGMRLMDGYFSGLGGNTGYENGYTNTTSDLVISRQKGVRHENLNAAVAYVESELAKHTTARVSNAITHAIKSIGKGLGEHAKAWRQHADLMAHIANALTIAFERIELRVLKGELVAE